MGLFQKKLAAQAKSTMLDMDNQSVQHDYVFSSTSELPTKAPKNGFIIGGDKIKGAVYGIIESGKAKCVYMSAKVVQGSKAMQDALTHFGNKTVAVTKKAFNDFLDGATKACKKFFEGLNKAIENVKQHMPSLKLNFGKKTKAEPEQTKTSWRPGSAGEKSGIAFTPITASPEIKEAVEQTKQSVNSPRPGSVAEVIAKSKSRSSGQER